MSQIELTLDVAKPPPPYIFTPMYTCGYAVRDDMLVGYCDREMCIPAAYSRTGKEERSRLCGLLPRHQRGVDLTSSSEPSLVNVIIPLRDISERIDHLPEPDGVFAYIAVARAVNL